MMSEMPIAGAKRIKSASGNVYQLALDFNANYLLETVIAQAIWNLFHVVGLGADTQRWKFSGLHVDEKSGIFVLSVRDMRPPIASGACSDVPKE